MIRVVLVDDHPVVRSGLAGLLGGEPDIEVVGEASDGREGVDLAVSLRPDVVLMNREFWKHYEVNLSIVLDVGSPHAEQRGEGLNNRTQMTAVAAAIRHIVQFWSERLKL